METTKIEWADSTVNPTENCDGCELWQRGQGGSCYAGRFTERIKGKGSFDQPIILHPGRMAQAALWSDLTGTGRQGKPWLDGRPRVIFLGDMADVLSRAVPFEYLYQEIIQPVTRPHGQRHLWMLLTKQARRLAQFAAWLSARNIPWPHNLWPGVSVTSATTTWRIDYLLKVPSARRFISYEPAREFVDFTPWLFSRQSAIGNRQSPLSLIILGGESGSKKFPFNIAWAEHTIESCAAAGVHCFIKQLGSLAYESMGTGQHARPTLTGREVTDNPTSFGPELPLTHAKGGDWSEWPAHLCVRQFPAAHV